MSKNRTHGTIRGRLRRGLSGILCLALLLGLLPHLGLGAQAASQDWAAPYINQLVDWGVMRGDISGNMDPAQEISRAELLSLINRAYGYNKLGGHPFTDVDPWAWYAEDVDIAYNIGYFKGTSPTTASPLSPVTREQAAVFLSRNLMLQGTVGETLGFADSRTLSEWSRGLVGAAVAEGMITGFNDGSFRPQSNITRGQMSAMLVRAIGTLIGSGGEYTLGNVYGNVTVNSPGVALRDGVILGNLYLTGGIDLGDVLLENVTVLGRIVISGAGESNSSQSSVILRNVEADEMIVDSIENQFVTIRAEGATDIPTTSVRTNAYVDDSSWPGYGLSFIELDGESGTRLQLAGNIKEVNNITPNSDLQFVQGVAEKVTVDEYATGSSVLVDTNTQVGELNLDVGAQVTGKGDIKDLNVGAAGSRVDILPEKVEIRPGITATIDGETMDSSTAAELSADPMLLAGYPRVKNIAPTTATGVYSTNKAGTVYWAISAVSDGSVSEEDLIENPAYGGNIYQRQAGRITASASNTEYTSAISRLTPDGSYYISAIMVDNRGNRSPLKVAAFTTPDNTVPAFTTGYPVITKNTTETAQVTAMTNKSCQLYYALLSGGSATPTPQEFKANAIQGNWGYGVVDMVKNVTQPIRVNRLKLQEKTTYDLYLWLTDYNGANSSAVRKLTFTTPDETPPVVTSIMQSSATGNTAQVTYSLNEPGTLYWAIVTETAYQDKSFIGFDLDTLEAKVKVESGVGAIANGASNAARADSDIRFTISRLNTNTTHTTSYKLYYVAKDRDGNYSAEVKVLDIRTLDLVPPTVEQEFTDYNDDNKEEPLADTDIRLVFSESVQGGTNGNEMFMKLYNDVLNAAPADKAAAREKLGSALRSHITMYRVPAVGRPYEVVVRDSANDGSGGSPAATDWAVDWRYAKVTIEDGKMVVTLPTTDDSEVDRSALKLDSGATYYFHLEGIYDTALTPNAMGAVNLPRFRTVFARVALSMGDTWEITPATQGSTCVFDDSAAQKDRNDQRRIDVNFVADPISVDRVDADMRWDLLLWSDTPMTFTLYSRALDGEGKPLAGEAGKWQLEGSNTIQVTANDPDGVAYVSLARRIKNQSQPTFPTLRDMELRDPAARTHGMREYGIHVDRIGGDISSDEFDAWNHTMNLRVSVVAGTQYELNSLSTGSFTPEYDAALAEGVAAIGTPDPFNIRKPFTDSKAPDVKPGYPTITVGDISATINVMMSRPGQIYYIVFPLTQLVGPNGSINTDETGLTSEMINGITSYSSSVGVSAKEVWQALAAPDASGKNYTYSTLASPRKPDVKEVPIINGEHRGIEMALPSVDTVTGGRFTEDVIKGVTRNVAANVAVPINLTNLRPNTIYYICMVTRGTAAIYADEAVCFRFVTEEAIRPTINLSAVGSTVNVNVDKPTLMNYFLAQNNSEGAQFKESFSGHADNAKWSRVRTLNAATGLYGDGTYSFTYPATLGDSLARMSVLDAMATPCYRGQVYVGSVFDVYAGTSAKNTYAGLIRSSSTSANEIAMVGSGSYSDANNNTARNQIACTGMKTGILYTFLAVGRSSDGSGDAFRAYYPISMSDTTPPTVTPILGTANFDASGRLTGSATVTLAFSEELYARRTANDVSQNFYPVDNCRMAALHLENTNSIAIGSLVQGGNKTTNSTIYVITDDSHPNGSDGKPLRNPDPISALQLSIQGIRYGGGNAVLVFNNQICDEAGNGFGRGALRVTVSVVRTRTGGTDEAPEYTYSLDVQVPPSWQTVMQ